MSSTCMAVVRNGSGGFITHAHTQHAIGDKVFKNGEHVGTIAAISPTNDASFVLLAEGSSATNLNFASGTAVSGVALPDEGDIVRMYGRHGMQQGTVMVSSDPIYQSPLLSYRISGFTDPNGVLYEVVGARADYFANLGDSGGVVVLANRQNILIGLQSARDSSPAQAHSSFSIGQYILNALSAMLV